MAKNNSKNPAAPRAERELERSSSNYNSLSGGWRDRANSLRERNDTDFDEVQQGYRDLFNTEGSSGGGTGIGGVKSNWGRDEFEKMRPFISSLGADLSAADKARLRGGGVYDEFAKTGGVSDADASNLRLRASRTGGALYDSLEDELATANNAQGGFNPGYGAQTAKLARDRSRGIADAALDAETGIIDTRNSGRKWGAEGMTSSESALQNLIMQRLLGAGGLQGQLAHGMQGADVAEQSDARQVEGLGLQRDSLNQQRLLAALSGMSGLYGSRQSEAGSYEDRLLRASGQQGNETADLLRILQGGRQDPSWMDRLGGAIGPIANALGRGGGGGGDDFGWSGGGGAPESRTNYLQDRPDQGGYGQYLNEDGGYDDNPWNYYDDSEDEGGWGWAEDEEGYWS